MQRVQNFYQQRARLYQRFFLGFLKWERVLETFFRAEPILRPGMRILDAGCGSGAVTRVLYRLAREQRLEGIQFSGFDLTPAMLDLFQQWIDSERAQAIQLRQANVLRLDAQLPEDWRGFDWVVSSAMLEYVPVEQRSLALCNLKGRLNEAGHILLFLTRRTRIARWTGEAWWGTRLFEKDALSAELQHAGFSNIRFHRLPNRWDAFMLVVSAGVQPEASGSTVFS